MSAEELYRRVTEFHTTSGAQQQQAHDWLVSFMRSSKAWQPLHELLSADGLSIEAYHYAATCLREKIRKRDSLEQLTGEQRQALRGNLLGYLTRITSGPVCTQLCLATAAITAQDTLWDTSRDVIQEVCTALSDPKHLPVLLQLLTLLGEEAVSAHEEAEGDPAALPRSPVSFGGSPTFPRTPTSPFAPAVPSSPGSPPRKRPEHPLVVSVRKSVGMVLSCLHSCYASSGGDRPQLIAILKCLSQWVRFSTLPPEQLRDSPLVQAAFQGMGADDTAEAASGVLCEAAHLCSMDHQRNAPLVALLTSQVPQMIDVYRGARSEVVLRAMCRTLVSIGKSFCSMIATGQGDSLAMLSLLVECASNSNPEIAALTYTFWYHLSRELESFDDATYEQRRAILKPCLLPLAKCLMDTATIRCDETDPDELEEWDTFREEVLAPAVRDVSGIIGRDFIQCVAQEVTATLPTADSDWRPLERALFVLYAASLNLVDAPELVGNVLGMHDHLPKQWVVQRTQVQLMGCLGWWLRDHGQGLIAPVLLYITQALSLQQSSRAAASAILGLSLNCTEAVAASHLREVAGLYQSLPSLPETAQEKLTESIGTLLCRAPPDGISPAVELVARSSAGRVEQGDHLNEFTRLEGLASHTLARLDSSDSHVKQALGVAWVAAWGVLWLPTAKLLAAGADEAVVEKVSQLIVTVVRLTGTALLPHLSDLANTIATTYLRSPTASLLTAVATLVDEFGVMADCVPPLVQLLAALAQPTFSEITASGKVAAMPDVLAQLYLLLASAVKRFPDLFLTAPLAAHAVDCGLVALLSTELQGTMLSHATALRGIISFFDSIVDATPSTIHTARHFMSEQRSHPVEHPKSPCERGAAVATTLLLSMVDTSRYPFPLAESMGLVLIGLTRLSQERCHAWLTTAMEALPAKVVKEESTKLAMALVNASGAPSACEWCNGRTISLMRCRACCGMLRIEEPLQAVETFYQSIPTSWSKRNY